MVEAMNSIQKFVINAYKTENMRPDGRETSDLALNIKGLGFLVSDRDHSDTSYSSHERPLKFGMVAKGKFAYFTKTSPGLRIYHPWEDIGA
ncbi:hypothetical protein CDAR_222231 [Caerostris darwini]|uniref:Uncharacterized protein n=1 Tax=Caerostris darwini TaxID=1538125 RepID=A0AAV4PAD8_9ARAC|nr:hypothetical protein CDAR_222231 [Caerostris darwini]